MREYPGDFRLSLGSPGPLVWPFEKLDSIQTGTYKQQFTKWCCSSLCTRGLPFPAHRPGLRTWAGPWPGETNMYPTPELLS